MDIELPELYVPCGERGLQFSSLPAAANVCMEACCLTPAAQVSRQPPEHEDAGSSSWAGFSRWPFVLPVFFTYKSVGGSSSAPAIVLVGT